ncbi:flagellar export chaperone FliS [Noviherbaspirillum autotrophicum]|uniref:Flagellar secretion chaperone FliS n=1 Tax=Noviherbaspirillum autotrophicum TaxID=709839 RepID=A0A0C2BLK8_9BURK|nr:flagellar export chaperone FliS [Noviherbaspirillum autotrophicum]KIF82140.1 flagellar biosynthesis protein FliS [Noviherbaspirillum autotrophicum]
MFGSMRSGANAYAKVGIETGVVAASPHKLIVMLFDGALAALATALQHMNTGNIPGKGQALSKAITIIDSGLRASLDHKVGGEIAANLDALYEYMSTRLMTANLNNQPELIEEVQRLLQDLRSAWEAIAPAGQAAPEAPPAINDPLAPNISGLVKA